MKNCCKFVSPHEMIEALLHEKFATTTFIFIVFSTVIRKIKIKKELKNRDGMKIVMHFLIFSYDKK